MLMATRHPLPLVFLLIDSNKSPTRETFSGTTKGKTTVECFISVRLPAKHRVPGVPCKRGCVTLPPELATVAGRRLNPLGVDESLDYNLSEFVTRAAVLLRWGPRAGNDDGISERNVARRGSKQRGS